MKPVLIASLSGILVLSSLFSGAASDTAGQTEPSKPAEASSQCTVRKITVRIMAKDGGVTSEVTVPAVDFKSEFSVDATTLTNDRQRRVVSVHTEGIGEDGYELRMEVRDPDRPALTNGPEDKGLAVRSSLTLFEVSTVYHGPGEYELYRNLWERMVVVIQ